MLHELERAVGVQRHHHNEIRFVDNAVDASGPISTADSIFPDRHPVIAVNDPTAEGRDVWSFILSQIRLLPLMHRIFDALERLTCHAVYKSRTLYQ